MSPHRTPNADRWRTLDDLEATRRATLARLQRINATLAAWEDYAADRGDDEVILSRDALTSLQRTLVEVLGELEALLAEAPAARALPPGIAWMVARRSGRAVRAVRPGDTRRGPAYPCVAPARAAVRREVGA